MAAAGLPSQFDQNTGAVITLSVVFSLRLASGRAAERRRPLSSLDVTPASDRVIAQRERLKGGPVKLGVNGPSFLGKWPD